MENKLMIEICVSQIASVLRIHKSKYLDLENITLQPRGVLTFSRVRHAMLRGNQIHSINVWTLGIPKMYMRTLGY